MTWPLILAPRRPLATATRWRWSHPMASLQECIGSCRVISRPQGRRHVVTLGRVSPWEAEAKAAQVDCPRTRPKQGLIELPPGSPITGLVRAAQPRAVSVGRGRTRREKPP